MATQYERDLRSAHKDVKRSKDSIFKWSQGTRPLPGSGIYLDDEYTKTQCRPERRNSEIPHVNNKDHRNFNKARRNFMQPSSRVRTAGFVIDEMRNAPQSSSIAADIMQDSPLTQSLTSGSLHRSVSGSYGDFLYSFDNTDSPPPALTLDVFVKPNPRATEKMVEKEYEVLDVDGNPVKGRKARQILRQTAIPLSGNRATSSIDVADEDDFELV